MVSQWSFHQSTTISFSRLWGNSSCLNCKGFCSGHYITKFVDVDNQESVNALKMPPSIVLKEIFSTSGKISNRDAFVQQAAKRVLLSSEDTDTWLIHLQTVCRNRKRGALKAAETRKKRLEQAKQLNHCATQSTHHSEEDDAYCGVCGEQYSSSESSFWISCNLCQLWLCAVCEGLVEEPKSATYLCKRCLKSNTKPLACMCNL